MSAQPPPSPLSSQTKTYARSVVHELDADLRYAAAGPGAAKHAWSYGQRVVLMLVVRHMAAALSRAAMRCVEWLTGYFDQLDRLLLRVHLGLGLCVPA
jgi:hypothetical protein